MTFRLLISIPVAVCAGALGRDLLPKAMKWLTEKKKASYIFNENMIIDKCYFNDLNYYDENGNEHSGLSDISVDEKIEGESLPSEKNYKGGEPV